MQITESQWSQLLARDPRADGDFFYAVQTTGIFCRPTCPSRRPRRENVLAFADAASARAAGFRPCQRCRPETDEAKRDGWIAAVCAAIRDAETPPLAADLARAFGCSAGHLQRTFRSGTGLTLRAYFDSCRTQRMRDSLTRSESVTEAIYDAGFSSSGRFYEAAEAHLGMTPTAFREGGIGLEIRYATGTGSLGHVLAAWTPRGICAVLLGDEAAVLIDDLRRRFPNATLCESGVGERETLATAIACIDTPSVPFTLPLDLRGSIFEHKVWQALRTIPAGATASYAEIARRIGKPTAARAVARACAANPAAVAIPCHRVVRGDGELSGYRWGVERKRELLAREAAYRETTKTSGNKQS